jgi:hypothetical protein
MIIIFLTVAGIIHCVMKNQKRNMQIKHVSSVQKKRRKKNSHGTSTVYKMAVGTECIETN